MVLIYYILHVIAAEFPSRSIMGILLDFVKKQKYFGRNCRKNSVLLCIKQVKSSYQRALNLTLFEISFLFYIFSSLSTVQGLHLRFLLYRNIYIYTRIVHQVWQECNIV